ncbi:MAG: 30S ribosomal protein S17e [Thermoplasmata archaeon]
MGRIRQTYIKRVAIELISKHGDKFTSDFYENREMVKQLTDLVVREGDKEKILYKKMLNRIAGYVTRYKKRKRHSIVG